MNWIRQNMCIYIYIYIYIYVCVCVLGLRKMHATVHARGGCEPDLD